jgi:tetratricopeptide (TPR) repeat protein
MTSFEEKTGPADQLDPLARRLLEIDEALDHPTTVRPDDWTQPTAESICLRAEGEDELAEQWLYRIEALRLTAPHIIADVFAPVCVEDHHAAETLVPFEQSDTGLTSIGRFRLIRELGKGGYGVVFLALDPTLNRQVALKIPRPEVLIAMDLRRRFLREAEAAAALDHLHIVPVYEAGSIGPVCYIASAFCEGRSLRQWLEKRNGKVTPHLAARIIEALAGALQHAHDRGILHRDVKPSNILIEAAEDAPDQAVVDGIRLTDFGLARITQDRSHETQSTAILGTPAFMAPEQAAGRQDQVGFCTDVYGLGATLYFLLTGRPPIIGHSQLETLSAIVTVDPLEARQFQPDVPRDLDAVCLKCLEKDPTRRYATAGDLRSDLQRFLQGLPVLARPVGNLQRLTKWCRRNPRVAALTVTASLAVLAALITAAVGWWSTSSALATADARYRETKAAIDKYFVAISDNQLLSAPGLKPLRQELLGNALDYYQRFLDRHQQDSQLPDELRRTYARIGQIHEELGDFADARHAFQQALRIADERLQDDPDAQPILFHKGSLLRKLANLDRYHGDLARAMAGIDEAIKIHRRLAEQFFEITKNEEQLGLLLSNKASVINAQGDIPRAEQLYRESEELFERLMRRFPQEPRWQFLYAQSRGNRSIMRRFMGQIAESKELLKQVVEQYRQLVHGNPEDASYQFNFGKALANMSTYFTADSELNDALVWLHEATAVFDRLAMIHPQVAEYHALRATTRKDAGLVHLELRRFAEAESLFQESLTIMQKASEASPHDQRNRPGFANINMHLGTIYLHLGDLPRAQRHIETAVVEYEQLYQDMPGELYVRTGLSECLERKGCLLTRQGRSDNALESFARGREILDDVLAELPDNPDLKTQFVANHVSTADTLELMSRFSEALQFRRKALELEADSRHNRRHLEFATTLARSGDLKQAKTVLAETSEPDHPDEWVIRARAHAVLAAGLAASEASASEHQQHALWALQQAQSRGLDLATAEYPLSHPDWSILHDLEEFQALSHR